MQNTWDIVADGRRSDLEKLVLLGYVMTSDMGPDQARCGRMISTELAPVPGVFFFHVACILHQLHLIVRSSLSIMRGYFASCAKICNVWRSWGNHAKIKSVWLSVYDPRTFPKTLPPRPLRGRWGSIEAIEKFLLHCGRERLLLVFKEALLAKAEERVSDSALVLVTEDDDDCEIRQYQLKLGRWAIEAINALGSFQFWLHVIIGSVSRGPLTHVLGFIMNRSCRQPKPSNKTAGAADSNKPKPKPSQPSQQKPLETSDDKYDKTDKLDASDMVIEFVTKLVATIRQEFNDALRDSSKWSHLITLVESSKGNQCRTEAFNTAILHTLLCFADFERRIMTRTNQFPLKLAWLLAAPVSSGCAKRVEIAKEIRDIDACVQSQVEAHHGEGGGIAHAGLGSVRLYEDL